MVLVHSRTELADPELLLSVRQQAKEVLLEKGVELVLGTLTHVDRSASARLCGLFFTGLPLLSVSGQKVSNLSKLKLNVTQKNQLVTTDKGQTLTVDLVISCTGLRINTGAYAASFCEQTPPQGVSGSDDVTEPRKKVQLKPDSSII